MAGELTLARRLQRVVQGHVDGSRRRRSLPRLVHVGVPMGEARCFPDEPWYDAGLRADLVTAALEGIEENGPLCVVLTRPGGPDPDEVDARWWPAAQLAFDRHGLTAAGWVSVGRYGWYDTLTGARADWSRIRANPERLADRVRAQPQSCTGSLACIRWR